MSYFAPTSFHLVDPLQYAQFFHDKQLLPRDHLIVTALACGMNEKNCWMAEWRRVHTMRWGVSTNLQNRCLRQLSALDLFRCGRIDGVGTKGDIVDMLNPHFFLKHESINTNTDPLMELWDQLQPVYRRRQQQELFAS